jgi:hypothetical protein
VKYPIVLAATLLFSVYSITDQRLVMFQKEAEKAIGKKIVITEETVFGTGGLSRCFDTPATIRLRPNKRSLQDAILAHEL